MGILFCHVIVIETHVGPEIDFRHQTSMRLLGINWIELMKILSNMKRNRYSFFFRKISGLLFMSNDDLLLSPHGYPILNRHLPLASRMSM